MFKIWCDSRSLIASARCIKMCKVLFETAKQLADNRSQHESTRVNLSQPVTAPRMELQWLELQKPWQPHRLKSTKLVRHADFVHQEAINKVWDKLDTLFQYV